MRTDFVAHYTLYSFLTVKMATVRIFSCMTAIQENFCSSCNSPLCACNGSTIKIARSVEEDECEVNASVECKAEGMSTAP